MNPWITPTHRVFCSWIIECEMALGTIRMRLIAYIDVLDRNMTQVIYTYLLEFHVECHPENREMVPLDTLLSSRIGSDRALISVVRPV